MSKIAVSLQFGSPPGSQTEAKLNSVTKRPDQLALHRAEQNVTPYSHWPPAGRRLQNRFQNQRRHLRRTQNLRCPQNRSQNYPQNLNLRCHQNLRRRWTHLRFTGFCSPQLSHATLDLFNAQRIPSVKAREASQFKAPEGSQSALNKPIRGP